MIKTEGSKIAIDTKSDLLKAKRIFKIWKKMIFAKYANKRQIQKKLLQEVKKN